MATTDDGPITGSSLTLTRVTGGASTITALGGAAVALFTINAHDPDGVKIAKIAAAALIVAVGLLATAWVTAADVRARGNAAAGAAGPTVTPAATQAAPVTQAAPAPTPQGAAAWVTVQDHGNEPFLVLEAHQADGHATRYFLARNDEKPKWFSEDAIESWHVVGTAPGNGG